jgi:hypothetical protein
VASPLAQGLHFERWPHDARPLLTGSLLTLCSVDEALSDRQLAFDLTLPPESAEATRPQREAGLVTPKGRVIDDAAIRQAVERAQRRLAEQSLRQARRQAQVSLWRSAR